MKRILIVEDELKLSTVLKDYLTSPDYHTTCCFDGPSAVADKLLGLEMMIDGVYAADKERLTSLCFRKKESRWLWCDRKTTPPCSQPPTG